MVIFVLSALYFFLPAYTANMAPVLFSRLKILSSPVNKRLFGENKTWRGLVVATLIGGVTFMLQKALYQFGFEIPAIIDYSDFPLWFGFLLGAGAILGDLIKSYYKRREQIAPGKMWFPYDQIDFAIGGLVVSCFYYVPSAGVALTILVASPILHLCASYIGHLLGLRKHRI